MCRSKATVLAAGVPNYHCMYCIKQGVCNHVIPVKKWLPVDCVRPGGTFPSCDKDQHAAQGAMTQNGTRGYFLFSICLEVWLSDLWQANSCEQNLGKEVHCLLLKSKHYPASSSSIANEGGADQLFPFPTKHKFPPVLHSPLRSTSSPTCKQRQWSDTWSLHHQCFLTFFHPMYFSISLIFPSEKKIES